MSPLKKSDAKPVVFISIVFCTLLFTSFISLKWKSGNVKEVNFIADITEQEQKSTVPSPVKLALSSTTVKVPFRDYLTYDGLISYDTVNATPLAHFMQALQELKKGTRKKVRIAYFGDSMIEGDLITQDLRQLLQEQFGGEGVGFVPITSIVAKFRQTIQHSYSSNWIDKSFKTEKGNAPLFLSGHYYLSGGAATVNYTTVSLPRLQTFAQAYFLYGKTEGPHSIVVNGQPVTLTGSGACNKLLLDTASARLSLQVPAGIPAFGCSFESEQGVFIDNFSFRGISGIELEKFNTALLQSIAQSHSYDLIVLQYGPNLLFKPKLVDFDWYEKPMTSIVEKLRQGFPGASVLVVSTADKSFRYNGQMETALGVEPLLHVQNRVAFNTQSSFWNLYRAMGGRNAMVQWVEGDTALANKDYTHFNHRGARKIGTMLFETIMKEFHNAQ